MLKQDKQMGEIVTVNFSAFFKDCSVVVQNCQRAHFPCPLPSIVCDRRRCEQSTAGTSYLEGVEVGSLK